MKGTHHRTTTSSKLWCMKLMNNPVYFDLRLTDGGVIEFASTVSLRRITGGATVSGEFLSGSISEVK